MKAAKKVDMTQGSIMKRVLLFALPICVGNVLQQLYGTVDTLVIGNFCGSVSLAAVGTSSQPVEILLCVFLGLGTGVSILVSQFTGSGDMESLKEIGATAISFLFLCAIPLTIIGQFAGPAVLRFMQVPDDTWELANAYISIIFFGTLGNMGYNMNAGILRGMGDSNASLLFLIVSCAVNIVLDLVFVAGLGMDVAGAAWATTIAMYCSWLFSIVYIRKKYPEFCFTYLPHRMNKRMLGSIVAIGLPLGLNSSIYSVGHILMQSLINLQGSIFIAACSVSSKVTGIANVAITSLSSAATTFSGQNLGAENYVYLKKGGIQIPLFSGLITCIAGLIVTFWCRPLLEFFTRDAEVLDIAVRYIRIVLPFTWAYAVFNGIICFVNGMGEVRFPTVVNLLMLWAVRIPCAWLITWYIDGGYVMACLPISFVFGMCCMFSYFFSKNWKKIGKLAAEQQGE
ncbi:putative MATE family efflux protein [Hungatella effluvii]|uniref:Putative MATE family efflux protein n=1 Tax=Hungatella effluvii TaxID=1096246 RepID=A0A2V3Y8K0_9FIRM|nr:MATE family efflux transporter [Hungatella effluvii]PXX55135.1 putative MATE family efflux protein [Hungatella effluvii]